MIPSVRMAYDKIMKRHITSIFTALALLCGAASAQDVTVIRQSGAYLYSEATDADAGAADSAALVSMAGKIARLTDLPYSSTVKKNLVLTYMDDIQRECGVFSMTGKDATSVARYISKNDLDRIFENRRNKVKEMVSIAETADRKNQTDVALRYYFWAETLMRSLPSPDVTAIAGVKAKREGILKGLKVGFDRQNIYNKDIVELTFTCNGKPVKNIDYKFFDGKKWSGVLSAKDGKGFVEVRPDSRIDQYRIKYEITPAHLQHLFREVSNVEKALESDAKDSQPSTIQKRNGTPAAERESSERKIDFSEVKRKVLDVVAKEEFQSEPDSARGGITPVLFTSGYDEAIAKVCESIASGEYDSVRGLFTTEGYETFNRLIRYGNARVLNHGELDFYSLDGEVFGRSVPMAFSFKGNNRQFVENIVFTFNDGGKISDLAFSLDKETVQGIVSQNGWTEEARIILINFLESYKTAYALKRLDYISSIFDDDALIITGRVLRNIKGPNEYNNNRYVTLTRQNKANYIKNLSRVFASQEYINIQFSDCEVMKLGKGEQLFGIKIRQEYFSATYSDSGYLFILVDLRDCKRPVIHVRTWQDEPDKNFGVIGPYNF